LSYYHPHPSKSLRLEESSTFIPPPGYCGHRRRQALKGRASPSKERGREIILRGALPL